MVAGCGPKIAKCFLFLLNITLWICGIALIAAGSYVLANYNSYSDLFSEDDTRTICWILIGVGCFTFIVGFAGCCGAIKESVCLLRMYFTFILVIILAEVTGGILAFVYRDDIEKSMMEGMQRTINETYGEKDGPTKAVNEIQETFDCCGASGYSDYKTSQHLENGLAVPESCCNTTASSNKSYCTEGPKGEPLYPNLVYSRGCVEASISEIESYYLIIGGIALGLIVFEILTMIFACCVIGGIKDGYEKYS